MSKALYRKYRSRSLDEIVGQEPIVKALKNAIVNDQLSHAYLFTGPRGVGKTSIARILAYNINNIPYDSDNLPLDIIEIDAASNRRIDEIRDLREKVNIAPVSAKYKVYIIDEVHMLTREAFNALLKTLEEPPKHVIFILATTESHKLPETIVSRTQRYSFSLATNSEVKQHLKNIAKKESIDIDDAALSLIAIHCGGSLRDSLSLLDQVRHHTGKITSDIVRQNLGLPSDTLIQNLYESIESGNIKELLVALEEAKKAGVTPLYLAEHLNSYIRTNLINNSLKISPKNSIELMHNLLLVESSSRPDLALEITLIEAQLKNDSHNNDSKAQFIQPPITISQPAKEYIKTNINSSSDAINNKPNLVKPLSATAASETVDDEIWASTLEHIRQTHNTLYSLLRMAKTDNAQANKLTLIFDFPFHQKRVNENKNKIVIANTLKSFGIENCQIVCELAKKSTPPEYNIQNSSTISDIGESLFLKQVKSVFGGAEVLE